MKPRDRGWLVLALFFCSGGTALVYEVIWSKFLSQMFGSTIYAQTVVLAAFMGGLAIGNRIFGKWADRLQSPVGAYGYLEIIIGLYAFFFPALNRLADRIFVTVGTGLIEHSAWLLLLKGALAVTLLLGPTILMGGTLPLLAAWLQKSSADAGRRSARFYSVNSLGAVTGSAIAGFWLVQNLGMISGLQMTALVNVLVGGIAIVLTRGGFLPEQQAEAKGELATQVAASSGTLRWAGATVALTGFVSMGLEVLASRSLSLLFGSSLQCFAIVLISFILGIGLGSAFIASPRWRGIPSEKLVVLLLCAAGIWVTLLVFNIEKWVDVYLLAKTGLGRSAVGYVYHQILTAAISLVVLGLPAACIGAVLPLMIRAVSAEGAPLGAKVGALLTWNTVGAVGGALMTGFAIMPLFGLRNAFGVLALCLAAAAFITAKRSGLRFGMGGAVASAALACAMFIFGGNGWRDVISSGVFRARGTVYAKVNWDERRKQIKILDYKDAPDATVSVEESKDSKGNIQRSLRINGKPDASTSYDQSTQLLVAHLPMIVRPEAQDVFLLGFGSGISAGALLAYPVKQVTVAENCAPVVQNAKYFTDWNRNVAQNPRARIWIEDARTVLKLRPQMYDVIITQPSNPWTVGVGSVFSKEYYELAATRLKPSGVMAQWFHTYEMHDGIVGLVLRTFSSVFPYVEVWDTSGGDIVMLGAMKPWASGPDVFRRAFELPGVKSDLANIGINTAEELLARQMASQRTGVAIAGKGPMQSDMFPVLEYAAPRAFFLGERSWLFDTFDERTRQVAFAPAEKRAVLQQIPVEKAQALFSEFASVNKELGSFLQGKVAGLPGVWKSPIPEAALAVIPKNPELSDTHPVGTALDAGDLKKAVELAQEALNKNPDDAQAAYVARVVEQEWKLRVANGSVSARK